MGLSTDLIQEFVKITNDRPEKKDTTSVTGVISIDENGNKLVKLGGKNSDAIVLTPVDTVSDVNNGDVVKVNISDHKATVIGNISSPSGSATSIKDNATKIETFDNIIAHRLSATEVSAAIATVNELKALLIKADSAQVSNADIENLNTKLANIDNLTSEDITSMNASITNLKATLGTFESITTDELKVCNAKIDLLSGLVADFRYANVTDLTAEKARIGELETGKLNADFANFHSADINTANIEAAAIKKLVADGGIINEIESETGTFTKYLIGVVIKGDLIEGGTVKADKLLLKGENGLYYQMNIEGGSIVTEELTEEKLQNGLDGTIILAKSLTADKISVSDLVAFGATIGGFNITDNSIYSGVKDSVENGTTGIYLDREGQISLGDGNGFIKYIKTGSDRYKLLIKSEDISLSSGSSLKEDLTNIMNSVNLKVSSEQVKIDIETAIADGVKSIKTNMGYSFDDNGLNVTKANSEMSTTITEDGMRVNKNGNAVLTAASNGVDAKDLTASTYLIVGGRSRFENYGKDRTACFWIGG